MSSDFTAQTPVDLSIGIVSYNTADDLVACIDSIIRETESISFEVIVVDNDSADASAKRAAEIDPRVNVLANQENLGFARAVNQALSVARGEFFLMFNPDSLVCDGALEKCVDFLRNTPGKVAVTCKVTDADGNPNRVMRGPEFSSLRAQLIMHLRLERFFARTKIMRRALLREFDYDKQSEITYASGCFIMMRSHIIRDLGGLDERFPLYAEDHDFSIRILYAGGRILYFPNARVVHAGAESSKHIGVISHEQMLANRYLLYRKHFGRPRAFAFAAIRCVGSIIEMIRSRIRPGTDPNGTAKAWFTILWFLGIRRARPLPQRKKQVG